MGSGCVTITLLPEKFLWILVHQRRASSATPAPAAPTHGSNAANACARRSCVPRRGHDPVPSHLPGLHLRRLGGCGALVVLGPCGILWLRLRWLRVRRGTSRSTSTRVLQLQSPASGRRPGVGHQRRSAALPVARSTACKRQLGSTCRSRLQQHGGSCRLRRDPVHCRNACARMGRQAAPSPTALRVSRQWKPHLRHRSSDVGGHKHGPQCDRRPEQNHRRPQHH